MAPAGELLMPTVLDPRQFEAGAHHRFWLIAAATITFFMAALWPQSVG